MASDGDRLRDLLDAANAITAAPSFDAVFHALADAARKLVRAHQAVSSLTVGPDFAQDINAVSLSDRYAAWGDYQAEPDGSGIYRLVCEENRPLRLTQCELEAHPRWRGFGAHAAEHPPLRGWLAVPLMDPEDGSNLGLLQVSDREGGEFTEEDEELLVHLARLGANAVALRRLVEARERERRRLETVLSTVPCGVAITNAHGDYVYTNERAVHLLGRSSESFADHPTSDPVWDIVDDGGNPVAPDDLPAMAAVREGRPIEDVTLGIRHGDGSRRWYLVSSLPHIDDASAITGAVTAFVDVTRSRDALVRLARSEARLRESQRVARTGSWEIDIGTGQVWASDILAEVVGRPLSELRSHWDVLRLTVHPEDQEAVEAATRRTIDRGEPLALSYRVLRPDGDVRHLDARGERQEDADGRAVLVGTLRDMTEERALQEGLDHAQRMEGLGRLAAGMAHDINNWLTVVLGHADLLAEQHLDDPSLAAIRTSAERAGELTQQVLAFARRTVMRPRVLDVNATLRHLEPIVRRLMPAGVEVTLDADADLPSVEVDPARLEQALLNLVNNAGDAMPDGGTLTLRTTTTVLEAAPGRGGEQRPFVTITVDDTGHGMDDATLRRALEPFFTTKPTGAGTGLGLSIAYGIVSQSGGLLTLDSAVDRGTRAEILLPVADGTLAEPTDDAVEPAAEVGGSETILVVEDDEQVRELVAEVLVTAGYRVLVAGGLEEARRQADTAVERVDLLVTALALPGVADDRQLAADLGGDDDLLPVVYVSSHGTPTTSPTDSDPERLVPKPFKPADLLAAVRDLLDGHGVPADG